MRYIVRILSVTTLIAAIFFLTHCGKDTPASVTKDTIDVSPESLSFAYNEAGMPKLVTVTTTAREYAVETAYKGAEKEWLDISAKGDIISVTADRNDSADTRTATLYIIAGTADIATVDIIQNGHTGETDYSIAIEPSHIAFDAAKKLSAQAAITTAGDGLTASVPEECVWLKAALKGRMLEITVEENRTDKQRDCTLTVSNAQGHEATLKIVQSGAERLEGITADPTELIFEATDALTATVAITTAGSSLEISVEDDVKQWLYAELRFSGTTVQAFVTAAPNNADERRGNILLTNAEGDEAIITVTQKAYTDTGIVLSPESLVFDSRPTAPQTVTATTSSHDITAAPETEAEWLSLSTTGSTITVTAADNLSTTPRRANVIVSNPKGDTATLPIFQEGYSPTDLSGTWKWTANCTASLPGDDYIPIAGEATVSPSSDGYTVTGIFGPIIAPFAAYDPTISLIRKPDGTTGVTDGTAFRSTGETFHSGINVEFPEYSCTAWRTPDAFAAIAVDRIEIDGRPHDRIVFPNSITSGNDTFPDADIPEGTTGAVHYIYYTVVKAGIWESPQIREAYRDIVLTRPAEQ